MYGYLLSKPQCLPKTVWACKTSVDHYRWKNKNPSNMIEFSLSKSSKRTICLHGQEPLTVEGTCFCCLLGNEEMQSYAEDGITVDIISVATSFEGLDYTVKEFDADDLKNRNVLLLPCVADTLSKQENALLERLLNQVIHFYTERSAASDMMCSAIIFELLSKLDEIVRYRAKNKKDKYINYYVIKADSILSRRFSEKLTLAKVAQELGITPNYLSTIYKASTGVGFFERLLEIRMNEAKKMFLDGELSLFEISQRVGFEDESHLRRRFKQYFGVSVREISCIDREQTLYHNKPQSKKEDP